MSGRRDVSRTWAWIIGAIGGLGSGLAISIPLGNLVIALLLGAAIGVIFAIAFGAFGYGNAGRSSQTDAGPGVVGSGDGKGDGQPGDAGGSDGGGGGGGGDGDGG